MGVVDMNLGVKERKTEEARVEGVDHGQEEADPSLERRGDRCVG
jgi:hypothetical protein